MSTDESLTKDAQDSRNHLQLVYDGWTECDGGCGDIYHPDAKLIQIGGYNFCAACIEEAGLIEDPDLVSLNAPLKSNPRIYP